jgi:hypothetical protein
MIFIALGVVVVLVVGVVVFRWWQEDRSFCHQVGALPDLTTSMQSDTSPARGILDYAGQLDRISQVAPDDDTKQAAQTLAGALHDIGQSLSDETITASAPGAIAALNTNAVQQAESALKKAITTHCPSH